MNSISWLSIGVMLLGAACVLHGINALERIDKINELEARIEILEKVNG